MRSQLALWRRPRPNAIYPLTSGGAGQFAAPAAGTGTTALPPTQQPSQPPATGGTQQVGTAPGGTGTGAP
jgi:hypothetical protein